LDELSLRVRVPSYEDVRRRRDRSRFLDRESARRPAVAVSPPPRFERGELGLELLVTIELLLAEDVRRVPRRARSTARLDLRTRLGGKRRKDLLIERRELRAQVL